MIIDGHAYCFPPLGEANGWPSAAEHLRYIQREMADHHQPVWRMRDRARMPDNDTLSNPEDKTLAGLKDVNFRAGGHGRFVWTADGEDFAKQYLPPYTADLSHPPEMMVAQMDYVGIDRALLHINPIMGFLNDYLMDCVARFPDRLMALANVREEAIETDAEGQVAEVKRAYAGGLCGLQFIVNARFRQGITKSWNDEACRAFWDGIAALGRPVFFTISPPCPRPGLDDYLVQLGIWRDWQERYPDVPAVLTHGLAWRMFVRDRHIELPDELFEAFRGSNAKLQLLFHIALGNLWDYPYAELHAVLQKLVSELGSDRLMWGTDMPNVERFCNYRQTLDTFRVHGQDVISGGDIDNILGGTAQHLFGL